MATRLLPEDDRRSSSCAGTGRSPVSCLQARNAALQCGPQGVLPEDGLQPSSWEPVVFEKALPFPAKALHLSLLFRGEGRGFAGNPPGRDRPRIHPGTRTSTRAIRGISGRTGTPQDPGPGRLIRAAGGSIGNRAKPAGYPSAEGTNPGLQQRADPAPGQKCGGYPTRRLYAGQNQTSSCSHALTLTT